MGFAASIPRISLILPVCSNPEKLCERVNRAESFLSALFQKNFEIIVAINGKTEEERERLKSVIPHSPFVRGAVWEGSPGKGNAIRAGFEASRGQWIFFTDSDLPYDLSAIPMAARKLQEGADFVYGSRRHPASRIRVSTALIEFLDRRRKISKLFLLIQKLFLGINRSDIQAGFKAMNRGFANRFFARMRETSYYYESECFLYCKANGYRVAEIPLTIVIQDSASTVNMSKEFPAALFATLKTRFLYEMGYYTNERNEIPHRTHAGKD